LRALYLRIWLTVVVALALFAGVSGWMFQRHVGVERERVEAAVQQRAEAWADLLQRSLPPADAPAELQAAALNEWSQRLRLPLALDGVEGLRIGASESYVRREIDGPAPDGGATVRRATAVKLQDGRTLWIARPTLLRRPPPGAGPAQTLRPPPESRPAFAVVPGLPEGTSIVLLLVVLFVAVAGGAYPVVRGLTRRLEALKQGVQTFGAGALHHRVAVQGRDEVAALARSFNEAAVRIEALLRANQSLLANASHELRSPLARMKMAVALLDDAAGPQREALRAEIHANIAELDALVEEVLLASRLDAAREAPAREPVELLGLAAEEAARVQAQAEGEALVVPGDERLIRRALRNLLENARRYGGGEIQVSVGRTADGQATVRVCDRGPGVPEAYRERIFEAFFRLPGHAEREGGVGLGLALVRQIAERHGGSVRCAPREGGGSCFTLSLPAPPAAATPPAGRA
jgi:signal transduction histidine kinase